MAGRGSSDDGRARPTRKCADLTFDAQLQSIQPKAASSIKINDELAVVADADKRIVARHQRHGIVGSFIDHVPEMLSCMDQGHGYSATVTAIDIPVVRVRVHAR
jgi:hypothetical protein